MPHYPIDSAGYIGLRVPYRSWNGMVNDTDSDTDTESISEPGEVSASLFTPPVCAGEEGEKQSAARSAVRDAEIGEMATTPLRKKYNFTFHQAERILSERPFCSDLDIATHAALSGAARERDLAPNMDFSSFVVAHGTRDPHTPPCHKEDLWRDDSDEEWEPEAAYRSYRGPLSP